MTFVGGGGGGGVAETLAVGVVGPEATLLAAEAVVAGNVAPTRGCVGEGSGGRGVVQAVSSNAIRIAVQENGARSGMSAHI